MKGVALAGGLGKRLLPLTKVTNKHLLPVYDQPMIYYPLQTLIKAGIDEVMLVTGGAFAGDFLRLLGDGSQFGLKQLRYTYQEGEDGIAAALRLARDFVAGDKVCVILGDNIIEDDIRQQVKAFTSSDMGCFLFLKQVANPQRFGVAVLDPKDRLTKIEEKPQFPKSNLAVTGIYLYDSELFDIIETLKPSARGEYEITDVSNYYIRYGRADYCLLDGWWSDAGTFASLARASELIRNQRKQQEVSEND